MPKSSKAKPAKKRVKLEKLPGKTRKLSTKESKKVKGGLTKVGPGTLNLNSSNSNAVGGSLAVGKYEKTGDGSV